MALVISAAWILYIYPTANTQCVTQSIDTYEKATDPQTPLPFSPVIIRHHQFRDAFLTCTAFSYLTLLHDILALGKKKIHALFQVYEVPRPLREAGI